MDFSDKRQSYDKGKLSQQDLPSSPWQLLQTWLQTASDSDVAEPYVMSLATCGNDNQPGVRTVLLRQLDADGLVFYSNYDSAKGEDLQQNPRAEALFFWYALERQVRVRGQITRLPATDSDAYFHKRPKDSQLAAWVSTPQSGEVASRAQMQQRFETLKQRYAERDSIPRPDFWGGYRLSIEAAEFWQGRANRMHDRILYQSHQDNNACSWRISRLLP